MTLDQLHVLTAVAETGSFQAASEQLHKSRPALSIAIKKLEEEMGFSIFSRKSYRPELTPRGKVFYEKANKLLHHAKNLSHLGQQLAEGKEPELNMTINAVCPLLAITTILHIFRESNPFIKLNLTVEYGNHAIDKLYQGEADLAVTEFSKPKFDTEARKWSQVTLLPVAAPAHPLAITRTTLDYDEVIEHTQIVLPDEVNQWVSDPNDWKGKVEYWTVSDYYVMKQILVSALGWGVIPKHLIQSELEAGSLVPLNIPTLTEKSIDLFILRRIDQPIGPIAQEMWDMLQ